LVLVHTDHASPPLTFGLSSLEDHPSDRYMDRTPHLDSSLGLIEGKSRAPWSLNLLNLDLDLHRHLVCPANQKGNSYPEITSSLDRRITFTPTVQHCSMATVIGLCLRLKLMQNFPPHFKIDIKVAPGSLANEESVNKQLNDKERVAAALENPNLRQLVDECLCSNDPYSH
jgi:hypothetical protein